jgi:hypothetical protein
MAAKTKVPERDEAWRERQALADADGRKEYSAAELVADHEADADLPYVDVLALSDRTAGTPPPEKPSDAEVQRALELKNAEQALKEQQDAAKVEAEAAAKAAEELAKREADQAKLEAEVEATRKANAELLHREELQAERDRIDAELKARDSLDALQAERDRIDAELNG